MEFVRNLNLCGRSVACVRKRARLATHQRAEQHFLFIDDWVQLLTLIFQIASKIRAYQIYLCVQVSTHLTIKLKCDNLPFRQTLFLGTLRTLYELYYYEFCGINITRLRKTSINIPNLFCFCSFRFDRFIYFAYQ